MIVFLTACNQYGNVVPIFALQADFDSQLKEAGEKLVVVGM